VKTVVQSEKAPSPAGPYSPALKVDRWIFLSGQGGFDPASANPPSTPRMISSR